ncbi:MAG TPA: CBS domain-containing protein, partial [Rhizomicrobium sp.]|nr:CBS domain-containing protein [Rhizomicrobium sp.]
MTRSPPTIRDDASVADAAGALVAQRQMNLPVVDGEGRYAGMFGIGDLLSLLVPRVALAGNLMANLRFVGDDPDELRRKFQEVKNLRVADVADRNAAAFDPESSEIEAIRHFCRNPSALPVVEKESRKVVGMISSGDAIRAIAGSASSPK